MRVALCAGHPRAPCGCQSSQCHTLARASRARRAQSAVLRRAAWEHTLRLLEERLAAVGAASPAPAAVLAAVQRLRGWSQARGDKGAAAWREEATRCIVCDAAFVPPTQSGDTAARSPPHTNTRARTHARTRAVDRAPPFCPEGLPAAVSQEWCACCANQQRRHARV